MKNTLIGILLLILSIACYKYLLLAEDSNIQAEQLKEKTTELKELSNEYDELSKVVLLKDFFEKIAFFEKLKGYEDSQFEDIKFQNKKDGLYLSAISTDSRIAVKMKLDKNIVKQNALIPKARKDFTSKQEGKEVKGYSWMHSSVFYDSLKESIENSSSVSKVVSVEIKDLQFRDEATLENELKNFVINNKKILDTSSPAEFFLSAFGNITIIDTCFKTNNKENKCISFPMKFKQ